MIATALLATALSGYPVIESFDPSEELYAVSGEATPEGANATYDPETDTLVRTRGGERIPNYLANRYAISFRPVNRHGTFKTPPVGWMTWYAVKFDACDDVVMRNARAFMEKFRGYTDERPVLWVDWEWCHDRKFPMHEGDGDVLTPRPSAYPRGLKAVADDLRALGFTPALWVAVVNDVKTNALWRARPEWTLATARSWCGPVWGDPSAPGFCEEYVPRLFALYRSWGYEAFKWDCLPRMFEIIEMNRSQMKDPSLTPRETFRRFVAAGRRAIGPDTYLESCSGEWGDKVNLLAIDLFDAGRIGGDIFKWPVFVEHGVRRILSYYPFHNTVFWADADNLVLREEYSNLAQARTRVSIYALAGVPITLGDEIAALDDARIEMLRKAMPVVAVRPASLSRGELRDKLLRSRVEFARPFGSWQVRAFSNMTTNETLSATLDAPGCAVWDFWRDELLADPSENDGSLTLEVPPADTRLVRVTPVAKTGPTLVSVSRHVTQGGYELRDYAADERGAKGLVRCPGRGDPVTVTFLLPKDCTVASASHPFAATGRLVRLRLSSSAKEDVRFELRLSAFK